MPRFKTLCASIKVDDNELPEYDVQVDENDKQVSCWVPSEAGKVSTRRRFIYALAYSLVSVFHSIGIMKNP